MASQDDVRRIAMTLPGVTASPEHFAFSVDLKGKPKGFVWVWLERIHPKKARVPQPAVIAVRVADQTEKATLLAADPAKFFTEPHYNGYPAVLVRLPEITKAELRQVITEAWRCMAPEPLVTAYDAGGTASAPEPARKRKPAAKPRAPAKPERMPAAKPRTSAKPERALSAKPSARARPRPMAKQGAPAKLKLTAAETVLLEGAGLGEAANDAPSALERSRIELEVLIRNSFTIDEAAKALGVSTSRIRQRLSSKHPTLYGIKVGRGWRIPRFQFDAKGKLVRGLDVVIPHIRRDAQPVAVRAWFTTPHQDLVVGHDDEFVTPKTWLSAGRSVDAVADLAAEI